MIKKISVLEGILDIDFQLVACELDTSAKNMMYICKDILEDGIQLEAFDSLVEDIEILEGVEIYSFDDNTILYEYLNEAVVIHNMLGVRYIIFDGLICRKMKSKLNSYK